jgi:hypothetical protein
MLPPRSSYDLTAQQQAPSLSLQPSQRPPHPYPLLQSYHTFLVRRLQSPIRTHSIGNSSYPLFTDPPVRNQTLSRPSPLFHSATDPKPSLTLNSNAKKRTAVCISTQSADALAKLVPALFVLSSIHESETTSNLVHHTTRS